MKKFLGLGGMVLVAAAIGAWGIGWGAAGGAQPEEGKGRSPAANFQLADLEGRPVSMAGLSGKVVLLDFWATWCSPCRAEIPHLAGLYTAYKGKGLEVIGLSVGEERETVRSFVKANGVNYPVALSTAQIEQAYGGIRGIPTAFLIDKKGRIARKFVGYQSKEVFERHIKALLAEAS